MQETASTRLRSLLERQELLVVPGVDNSMTARIVERAGYKAVYVSGYGMSASVLGKFDMGLLTFTEISTIEANIADAVDLPVIGDGETGFGREVNVVRAVKFYERMGIAGMQLDDVVEETCPYIGQDLETAPVEKIVSKIKAAVDARRTDFCVFVTCTAYGIEKRREAEDRISAYIEAGADGVYAPTMTLADMEYWGGQSGQFKKPLIAIVVPIPDQSPTLQELKKWGYRMVWVSVNTLYAGYLAQQRFLNEMLKTGRTLDPDTVMDHEEFLGLLSM